VYYKLQIIYFFNELITIQFGQIILKFRAKHSGPWNNIQVLGE